MVAKTMKITEAGAARSRYRTRMLTADDVVTMDGPTAKLHERMGCAVPHKGREKKSEPANQGEPADEMKALRAEYRAKFGKGPGPSWDASTIREKIAAG